MAVEDNIRTDLKTSHMRIPLNSMVRAFNFRASIMLHFRIYMCASHTNAGNLLRFTPTSFRR